MLDGDGREAQDLNSMTATITVKASMRHINHRMLTTWLLIASTSQGEAGRLDNAASTNPVAT